MTLQNTSLIRKPILFLAVAMLSLSAMAANFSQTQRLANQGIPAAQHNLGVMYYEGKGVRQDYAKAKEWVGKSCDNGLKKGCDGYKILNEQVY